jgi:hypothetical protein
MANVPKGNSAADLNGHIWTTLEEDYKVVWIIGFASGCYAVVNFSEDYSQIIQNHVMETFAFYDTIEEMMYKIDAFYKKTDCLDWPIWQVIFYIYNRHWWEVDSEIDKIMKNNE